MFPQTSDMQWETFLLHFAVIAPSEKFSCELDMVVVSTFWTEYGEVEVWLN